VFIVGIDNNAEEEKKQKQINQRHQKLRRKLKSKKNHRTAHRFTIYQRDYRGEEENPHSRPLCTMTLTIV